MTKKRLLFWRPYHASVFLRAASTEAIRTAESRKELENFMVDLDGVMDGRSKRNEDNGAGGRENADGNAVAAWCE